jgi:hypothetical protein
MDPNDLVNKEIFQRFLDLYPTLTAQGQCNPYPDYYKTPQQNFEDERKILLHEEDNFYFCYELILNMPKKELREMIDKDSFSISDTYRRQTNRIFSDGVFILALYAHGVKLEKRLKDEPLMFVARDQPENSIFNRPPVP